MINIHVAKELILEHFEIGFQSIYKQVKGNFEMNKLDMITCTNLQFFGSFILCAHAYFITNLYANNTN